MYISILISTFFLSSTVLCDGFLGFNTGLFSIPTNSKDNSRKNGLNFGPIFSNSENKDDSTLFNLDIKPSFKKSAEKDIENKEDFDFNNEFKLESLNPIENKDDSQPKQTIAQSEDQEILNEDIPFVNEPVFTQPEDKKESENTGFNLWPFSIGSKNYDSNKKNFNIGPLSVGFDSLWDAVKIDPEIQAKINDMVDKAVAKIIEGFHYLTDRKIRIPDVHKIFTTGFSIFQTTVKFDAYNGTFTDLTSLARIEDVKLKNNGMKFIGSAGFRLTDAKIEYKNYKARYGYMDIEGELFANVSGVKIYAEIEADYITTECSLKLKDLSITDLGRIKLNFTGLGPLDNLASFGVSSITNIWKDKIVDQLEDELRVFIEDKLKIFNCETYRPTNIVNAVKEKLEYYNWGF